MTSSAWIQLVAFLVALAVLAWPLGIWLTAVADGRLPGWLKPVRALEAGLYRLAGVDAQASMGWKPYALGILAFNVLGVLLVYAVQRLQGVLPLNPQAMVAVSPDSSFNTAFSFVTNTDWQGYGGESTMSYLTQMLALTVQNFFSAATGIAVVFALIRGFAARSSGVIGNVWTDLTRVTVYVLLPLSLVFAVVLVGQGVIQNFDGYKDATTLEVNAYQNPKNGPDGQPLKDDKGNPVTEDATTATQQIAMGPVASQEAIKMIGTNGGGFFNANSAHPYENPTPLSNFLQMLSIFLIPAALVFAFGRMVGDMRQGVAVLAIAGSLAFKKRLAVTVGTLPTHGPLFVCLLIGSVLLVGLLNYVPALALGPVVEHFMLWSAK
jgi:K+-transporting ATPase ATPase A chain